MQQLVESHKLQNESQNRQIADLLRQVASLTDEVASLKVPPVQTAEEEETTKRALKAPGKLNRNKTEKHTPPAQETKTTGNNKKTTTEKKKKKKEREEGKEGRTKKT